MRQRKVIARSRDRKTGFATFGFVFRSSGPQTDARIDPKDVVAVETSIRSSLNPNVVSDDDNYSDGGDMDEETR